MDKRVRVVSSIMMSGAVALACAGSQGQTAAPAASAAPRQTQQTQSDFYRTHYTKREVHIAMRDGVKLFASVYTPVAAQFADKGPYPFLMTRTPYGCAPYGEDKISPRITGNQAMLESGYILVCEDVRGRWNSEGTWLEMTPSRDGKGIDESTDTYDTVDWLLKNVAENNGKVGILGISYPGFYSIASIIDGHPAIKAASPQAPIVDLFKGDDAYHGGAFMLTANHSFYAEGFAPQHNPTTQPERSGFKFSSPDAYKYYLDMNTASRLDSSEGGTNPLFHDQVANTTYNDYWKARSLESHMHGVKAAVLAVGGWFDAEDLSGPVKVFHSVEKLSPEAAEDTLVEGPWVHGGWSRGTGAQLGDIKFGNAPSEFYLKNIEAPFFAHWLKGADWTPLPKAYTFETGTNVWKKYPAWPPPSAVKRTLYLQPNGGLGWTPPTARASADDYVSDPAHPVPYTPYVTGADVPQRYMDDDQRFASTRPDVLTYKTEPLTEDVTVVGPVNPRLQIASTGTDADFDVKLIDVFPDDYRDPDAAAGGRRGAEGPPMGGYEMLIRGEPFRAKFRNSMEKPEALTPGKVTEVAFSMQDINHTFRKGHRIMVQVQSTWFPLVDRNPQVFMDIAKAKPEDFRKATETVFHQAGAASGLELMVLP